MRNFSTTKKLTSCLMPVVQKTFLNEECTSRHLFRYGQFILTFFSLSHLDSEWNKEINSSGYFCPQVKYFFFYSLVQTFHKLNLHVSANEFSLSLWKSAFSIVCLYIFLIQCRITQYLFFYSHYFFTI